MVQTVPLLEVHLFGVPRLLLNGRDVDSLRRKNRAVVYYLAARGQSLTRDNLLALFWPDHDRSTAQPILRTMIYDLRKQLGESFQAEDQVIAFSSNIIVDVKNFSTVLDSPSPDLQSLTNALSLYQGDFLQGFSLNDSAQFEDWAVSERERYRLMAARGFAQLAHCHEETRDYPAALESMRRALSFNLFQEDLQREVMRLLYLKGDRVGVIRQYEALRKLLDEEMGVPPMPETRSLYDSIINDTFVASSKESSIVQLESTQSDVNESTLPFAGREAELEKLKSTIGSGKLILLEGEPGIGKTRLFSELIASQTRVDRNILVLRGAAYELEQGLPYQPVVDALRSLLALPAWKTLSAKLDLAPVWLTELARLLPELLTQVPGLSAPVQPADEPRLWESLLQFFRALSKHGKVWLFLDDVHWADAATIGWLGYFIRHISSPSLTLVAASRPVTGQANLIKLLQTLKREDRLVQIQLSALTESAMQKMASTLSPEHDSQLSGWLMENAEGNPFFLTELIRYAQGIGLLKDDGTLDAELFSLSPIIPATIQNLIESRLLRVSEKARDVLHLAAIIGREFDIELIQQASSFAESDILDAIEELQTAHLIRPLQTEKFAFDHSLTMQVTLQDISQPRQRSLHRRIAEALESVHQRELNPVSGLIAHHFIDGNLPERGKDYAFRAGQFAAGLAAWVAAIAFFQQALGFESDETKRARILAAMGTAHFHKGDFVSASEDYQSVVELAQESQDWTLLEDAYLGLSLALFPQVRFAEAIRVAKELRESGPPELAICAEFIWGASLIVESAHPAEAERHLREAERLLHLQEGTFRSKVTPSQIKYSLAGAFGQQGQTRKAIEQFREVLEMLERGEGTLDTLRNIMANNNLAYYLHLLGDASAMDYVEKGISLAKERGSLSHLPYLYSTSGEIALANGDLDAAEKYFSEGLVLAEQIPIPERIAGMTANLGLVAKEHGDLELARERLQTALKLVEPLGNHHLEVRIRIWLSPLLSLKDARACLKSARSIADRDGLTGLLEQIGELEKNLS